MGHPCHGLSSCQFSACNTLPFSTSGQARDRQTEKDRQTTVINALWPHLMGWARNKISVFRNYNQETINYFHAKEYVQNSKSHRSEESYTTQIGFKKILGIISSLLSLVFVSLVPVFLSNSRSGQDQVPAGKTEYFSQVRSTFCHWTDGIKVLKDKSSAT